MRKLASRRFASAANNIMRSNVFLNQPCFRSRDVVALQTKHIQSADKKPSKPGDNRRAERYPVGGRFPFKVELTLFPNGPGAKGKDWHTTAVNLSASGAKVELSLAAVAFPEESCQLKFKTGGYDLKIPATIAHFQCSSKSSVCGVSFNFPDDATRKAYSQLLEPVMVGASLVPISTIQDTPDRFKERFGGDRSTQLTVWRTEKGGQITAFDMRLFNYGVRWAEGSAELELYGVGEVDLSNPNATPPTAPLTEAQSEEVRWLFCLSVPNLSEAVPADVRHFLGSLVA